MGPPPAPGDRDGVAACPRGARVPASAEVWHGESSVASPSRSCAGGTLGTLRSPRGLSPPRLGATPSALLLPAPCRGAEGAGPVPVLAARGPLCSSVSLCPRAGAQSQLCARCRGAQRHLCERSTQGARCLRTLSPVRGAGTPQGPFFVPFWGPTRTVPNPPSLRVMPGQGDPNADPITAASIPTASCCHADFGLSGKANLKKKAALLPPSPPPSTMGQQRCSAGVWGPQTLSPHIPLPGACVWEGSSPIARTLPPPAAPSRATNRVVG